MSVMAVEGTAVYGTERAVGAGLYPGGDQAATSAGRGVRVLVDGDGVCGDEEGDIDVAEVVEGPRRAEVLAGVTELVWNKPTSPSAPTDSMG